MCVSIYGLGQNACTENAHKPGCLTYMCVLLHMHLVVFVLVLFVIENSDSSYCAMSLLKTEKGVN